MSLQSDTRFIKGFWWRPGPDSPVDEALNDMVNLGVTDVWVWWEPFYGRTEEWHALCAKVKGLGIRFHMWVSVNHHYGSWGKSELVENPEWAAVARNGQSVLDQPFAGFQYWYCPSARDRWDHEISRWKEAIVGSDGLHLDYIRYPDGFRFGESPAIHRQEVAEQSYCYCPRCRQLFREAAGVDPIDVPVDPSSASFQAWQAWRRQQIVDEVGTYHAWLAHDHKGLSLTAAVFPTPQIARDNVQQDWAHFSQWMDAVSPMIYAKAFWEQPVTWVKDAVQQGLAQINSPCKLVAGLGTLDTFTPGEIETAVQCAVDAGAHGTVWFHYPFHEPWQHEELARAWKDLP